MHISATYQHVQFLKYVKYTYEIKIYVPICTSSYISMYQIVCVCYKADLDTVLLKMNK